MPAPPPISLLLRGTVIDCASRTSLRVLERAVLGINSAGFIAFVEDEHTEPLSASSRLRLRSGEVFELSASCEVRELPPRGFVVPGFVDTHTHAPQFAFYGLGYELQLLEWLTTYTFPSEAKFSSLQHAARICRTAVSRTLRAGTTSCVWFATIHTDAAVQVRALLSIALPTPIRARPPSAAPPALPLRNWSAVGDRVGYRLGCRMSSSVGLPRASANGHLSAR